MCGIRMEMRAIVVGMWETGDGNEGNQRENLLIGVEMMKKKCGEG